MSSDIKYSLDDRKEAKFDIATISYYISGTITKLNIINMYMNGSRWSGNYSSSSSSNSNSSSSVVSTGLKLSIRDTRSADPC